MQNKLPTHLNFTVLMPNGFFFLPDLLLQNEFLSVGEKCRKWADIDDNVIAEPNKKNQRLKKCYEINLGIQFNEYKNTFKLMVTSRQKLLIWTMCSTWGKTTVVLKVLQCWPFVWHYNGIQIIMNFSTPLQVGHKNEHNAPETVRSFAPDSYRMCENYEESYWHVLRGQCLKLNTAATPLYSDTSS